MRQQAGAADEQSATVHLGDAIGHHTFLQRSQRAQGGTRVEVLEQPDTRRVRARDGDHLSPGVTMASCKAAAAAPCPLIDTSRMPRARQPMEDRGRIGGYYGDAFMGSFAQIELASRRGTLVSAGPAGREARMNAKD